MKQPGERHVAPAGCRWAAADDWQEFYERSAVPPEPQALVGRYPSAGMDEIAEVLLVDQHLRWSQGPGPRVEEYLQLFPGLASHPQRLVDLVYGEARARDRLGFPLEGERFGRRFPAISAELTRQFELTQWFRGEESGRGGELPGPEGELPGPEGEDTTSTAEFDFGPYELLAPISRGGMGVVYKARDTRLGRIVALKRIPAERLAAEEEVLRFANEVAAVSQLDHPAIISILDVGNVNGVAYFTSPLIEPGSLADHGDLVRGCPRKIARLMRDVAEAVHHAHQRGILHRDLKPSNVLIDSQSRPYVTDFGLAKLLHQQVNLTHSGELLGTPIWLAPEQASGKPGGATIAGDIYGLGALLYFLLTGRPPFEGTGLIETLARVRESEPPPPSQLDLTVQRDLEMICLKAMDREPARRYATAEALARDLDCFLRQLPVSARPLPWWERQRRKIRRRPLAAGVLAVLLLAGTLLAGTLLAGMATYYTVNEARLHARLNALVNDARVSKREAQRMRTEAAAAGRQTQALWDESRRMRDEASQARQDHQQLLYAAHMQHAAEALAAGDSRRGEAMLRKYHPDSGSTVPRGFEWYWMWRQLHVPGTETPLGLDNPRCLACSADARLLAVGDSSGRVSLQRLCRANPRRPRLPRLRWTDSGSKRLTPRSIRRPSAGCGWISATKPGGPFRRHSSRTVHLGKWPPNFNAPSAGCTRQNPKSFAG